MSRTSEIVAICLQPLPTSQTLSIGYDFIPGNHGNTGSGKPLYINMSK